MNVAPNHKRGRPVDPALRDRRCEEILDAAAELFAQRGYADTDTQVLADTLGVGKGTLYHYFPSKQDLFLAAADRVMRRLGEFLEQAIAGRSDPLEQVAVAIEAFLAFFDQHPGFVELLIQERALFKHRHRATYFEHYERNVIRWQELYRQLIRAGRVRTIPVERITSVISDLLYGTIFSNYFAGRQRSLQQQASDIVDMVFCGILSETERQSREAMG
jgi:AcrR family transcriptional regulator